MQKTILKKIAIFTDGSCLGNPGAGGYGVILRLHLHEKEISGGYFITTNNRMELLAAIVALETLKEPCEVDLYSDSQYLKNGILSWIHNWKKNGWLTSNKKPVKNRDLWMRLEAATVLHTIHWHWVKGHSGHLENERCDNLARQAALNPTQNDVGFNENNDQ